MTTSFLNRPKASDAAMSNGPKEADAKSGKSAVRGMSFAEGEAALSPAKAKGGIGGALRGGAARVARGAAGVVAGARDKVGEARDAAMDGANSLREGVPNEPAQVVMDGARGLVSGAAETVKGGVKSVADLAKKTPADDAPDTAKPVATDANADQLAEVDTAAVDKQYKAFVKKYRQQAQAILQSTEPRHAAYQAASPEDLACLIAYTDQNYDAINTALRGFDPDPEHAALFTRIGQAAARALVVCGPPNSSDLLYENKMHHAEKGAYDRQDNEDKKFRFSKEGRRQHAAKKQRKIREKMRAGRKNTPRTYRKTEITDRYEPVFATYRTGAVLEEKGFLSTSTTNSYSGASNAQIVWCINDPTGGVYLDHLTAVKGEDELLLPPGTQVQIETIDFIWNNHPNIVDSDLNVVEKLKGPATERVSDPKARFKKRDGSHQAWNDRQHKRWEVSLKLVPKALPKAPDEDTASETASSETDTKQS